MIKKGIISIVCIMLIFSFFTGCEKEKDNSSKPLDEKVKALMENKDNPVVTIKVRDKGEIIVELYPDIAPNTVRNFVSLIKKEFYNGLIFHRVIPGFMIQGGCPKGDGTGGPGYNIKGEFSINGFNNKLKHTEGVISMARSQHNDSAGSQFFIMVEQTSDLDGAYAAFGKVIEGMDVVRDIVTEDRDARNKPKSDQVIESITVINADGIKEPETIK